MFRKRGSEASQASAENDLARPAIERRDEGGRLVCMLSGDWDTQTVALVDDEMRELENAKDAQRLSVDVSRVGRMDTAGAWVVERLVHAHRSRGAEVAVSGQTESLGILFDAVGETLRKPAEPAADDRKSFVIRTLEALGRNTYSLYGDFLASMHILGATIRGGQLKLGRGHSVNLAAIFNQIDRMGVGAIPVVVLMSFIVGAIVAQQGAFQLRYFGAEIFVVDLVGILVLREMGVLLTAIMVAGRSGSAITAEIGSMKMREEVDALTVIGLNPVGVLVFPRLVALVIALPCLTILANFAAIGGAITVTWVYSGITPDAFLDRMRSSIDIGTIMAGLIKAPFMALIIGIIGSVEGMKVGGSAESLGRHVTSSVVKSIFVVIVLDGMFAIFYAAIDF
ncbi:MAG: MlaE family lipid ABC transporter permease subunit [Rhizobiaceae bacterium]|nr:MlaE family lipid ABC transporter permease subunit [Rhizobiaceae bacterium]